MAGRNAIAIEMGRRRLCAVQVKRHRQRVAIKRVLVEPVAGLDLNNPEAVGKWIGESLRNAGFPRAKAAIALTREHVGLKRMTLPTTEPDELPDMTRHAMARELPFDAATAVIDFVPTSSDAVSTTVVAIAVPQVMLTNARTMAAAAGMGLERIALRSMGSAALVRSMNGAGTEQGGGVLAIDITGEGVEFNVVHDGAIQFSRAAELPDLTDPAQLAEAVVTEARRTWMSYRVVEESDDVKRAVLMGDPDVCRHAVEPLREMLGVPAQMLDTHPLVDSIEEDMDVVWPLAGLLLAPGLGAQTVDFHRPRVAPDLAARRRQRILAAAAITIIATAAAWTSGHRAYLAEARIAEDLKAKATGAMAEHHRFLRDQYKLDHLLQWDKVDADWLAHAQHVLAHSPPPDQVVLDALNGSLNFGGVRWTKETGWTAASDIRLSLEGEAKSRALADALRDALVRDKLYITQSAGADTQGGKRLPFSFTYHLRTAAAAPPQSEAAISALQAKGSGS